MIVSESAAPTTPETTAGRDDAVVGAVDEIREVVAREPRHLVPPARRTLGRGDVHGLIVGGRIYLSPGGST